MTNPLRVLLDGRMFLGRFSGVARMVAGLVDQLCANDRLQVTILCGTEAYPPWTGRPDRAMLVTDFGRQHRSPLARLWWEETRLRHWIKRSGCDVYHATWNHGVPPKCPIAAILTVHDLIPWDAPAVGLSTWSERGAYRMAMRQSARRADRIVTVSQFTASQLMSRLAVDPSHVRVIHNGVGTPFHSRRVLASDPYFLYVGGHEPRKNIEAIFAAMDAFWRSGGYANLRLTGTSEGLSPHASGAYQRLQHKERITFLGAPHDAELSGHYAGAAALLMLSRAEGFGLPVIEAMRLGCPVIASCGGSLPEVVGDGGLLVDPDRIEQVVEAMARTLDPVAAMELRTRGLRRAGEFTWERAAVEYLWEYKLALSCDFREPKREPRPAIVAVSP